MGMIGDLRNRVRWQWNRARYVAQTEGLHTAVSRAAGVLGLSEQRTVPEQLLVRPEPTLISEEAAQAWPTSLLLLAPAARAPVPFQRFGRVAAVLAEQGVPVAVLDPQDAPAAEPAGQLADLVWVYPPHWQDALPGILRQAHRLRQHVVYDVAAPDLQTILDAGFVHLLATADHLVADSHATASALREALAAPGPHGTAVHVLADLDQQGAGAALADLLAVLAEGPAA